MSRREEVLAMARKIPSIPAAALEALQLLQDPEVDIADLVRTIEYDPGLTSNLLRLANSAYYGGMGTISSLRDAIVRLGTKCIYQMIITAAVSPLIAPAVKGYDLSAGDLWKHSVAVAVGSEQLAAALNITPPEHTFTSALLHDIGKIVLGTFVEVDASTIMTLAEKEKVSFEVAEQIVLGIDHAEVGSVLLQNWNLPQGIIDVNRWHHYPERIPGDTLVVDLVHVADSLCMMGGIGTGSDGLHYRPSRTVVARLKLTSQVAETAVCGTLGGLKELETVFMNGNGDKPEMGR